MSTSRDLRVLADEVEDLESKLYASELLVEKLEAEVAELRERLDELEPGL